VIHNNNALIDTSYINSVIWNTAIYTRISEEEGLKTATDSIANQKKILNEYAYQHGLKVFKTYEDDGFRGGSFNRPAFKQMINDIDNGLINCVLVKDLSRFGREHIDTDHYLERYFPMKGVRFISAIQRLDSVADPQRMNSIEVPLINIFNEQYLKQVSNSTKASLMIKRKEGKFVGSKVPYGYIRSKEDKHKLIINDDVYKNIQSIFDWYINYVSMKEITKRLNALGILPPASYRKLKSGKLINKDSKWNSVAIKAILTQEIYTGDMVQGKTYSYNCKINKREPLPREKWDIVKNTHEPIISKEQFELAQALLAKKAKPVKSTIKSIPSIYSGFLTCADCGKKMIRNTAYYTGKSNCRTAYNRYVCSTYKKLGSEACSSHLIREDVLNDIVLDVLKTMISSLVNAKETMQKIESSRLNKQVALLENDKYKVSEKLKKTNKLLEGLYSDYKEEIISLSEYKDMKKSFENRHDELIFKKATINDQMLQLKSEGNLQSKDIENYLSYEGITQIDRNILINLADEIIVDNNRNITINLNAEDELKKYCSFLDM
jgi:site-specific DNA recombinase